MTIIKSESDSENPLNNNFSSGSSSSKNKNSILKAIGPGSDSRPALKNKPLNVTSLRNELDKNSKKQSFEEFCSTPKKGHLSPTRNVEVLRISPEKAPKIKFELDSTKAEVEDRGISIKRPNEENADDIILTANSASDDLTSIFKKKKTKPNENIKMLLGSAEMSTNSEKTEPTSDLLPSLEKPGEYTPILKSLYEPHEATDASDQNERDIFHDIDQDAERAFCQNTSKLSLSDWITEGQNLLNTQTYLIGELIRERIELSNKFQAITTAINERAEALVVHGNVLDGKLDKIRSIGKEILNII